MYNLALLSIFCRYIRSRYYHSADKIFVLVFFSLCRISESDSILLAAKKFSRLIDIYAGKPLPSELSKSKISGNSELKIHTVQELRELLGIASEPMTTDSVDASSYPPSEFIASQSGKTIEEEGKYIELLLLYSNLSFEKCIHFTQPDSE